MLKRFFPSGVKVAGVASALLAALMLLTSGCNSPKDVGSDEDVINPDIGILPPVSGLPIAIAPDVPVVAPVPVWDFIQLMVKIDPLEPYDERFLDDWRFQLQNIDDQGRPLGPTYFGESGPDGTAAVGLPQYMFQLPLVINAYNDAYPLLERLPRHHRDHGSKKKRDHRNGHGRDGIEGRNDRVSVDGIDDFDDEINDIAFEDNGDIINRCHYGRCDGFKRGHECPKCDEKRDDHRDCHEGCNRGCRDRHEHDSDAVAAANPMPAADGTTGADATTSVEGPIVAADANGEITSNCEGCGGHDREGSCRRCGERCGDNHDRHCKHKKCKHKKHRHDDEFQARSFEIFVPPGCYNQAIWLLGPLENAVWDYYDRANQFRGEAWNASQVDCATWLANLQLLIQTDKVNEELHEIAEEGNTLFDPRVLVEAYQENQNFLVPTRPPICMAERRHTGGGLDEGFVLEERDFPHVIAAGFVPFEHVENADVIGPELIVVNENGSVRNLCGQRFHSEFRVNGAEFDPTRNFVLKGDGDFMGTVHMQDETVDDLNVSIYNIRLGNGRPLDSDVFDEACALTQLAQFTNIADEDQDLLDDTGVTFFDLFEEHHKDTRVWLTSDGDAVVNDDDTWAILFSGEEHCRERVLAVELIGIRAGDYRDTLFMERRDNHGIAENDGEDLFIGLRADYRLEEETIDGEYGFFAYTLSYWDGSNEVGRENVRTQIANCYEAADVWARQFFNTIEFQDLHELSRCCLIDCPDVDRTICPLRAAEMAVRSQCFSNSRSNSRWQTQDVGFWSLNNNHGVHANVIVNPGWLGPNMDFEIYIQKFDEAVFKGPRTIVTSDCYGQIMTALPTLVEGDRILIKAQDACCSDYDVVLPCVPEFTGFVGLPGIAYVPQIVGPVAPVVPVPAVVPAVGVPAVGGAPAMGAPGMGGPAGMPAVNTAPLINSSPTIVTTPTKPTPAPAPIPAAPSAA